LDAGPPGLLYVDRHFDLNTPDSTTDGALDWMGLAHGFALPGTIDALTGAFGHGPLLQPTQVAWLGVDAGWATAWEREQADRLGLQVTSSTALANGSANRSGRGGAGCRS
jgi:arginase